MRLFVKRLNRLTYAFSKKWDNHHAALAMFFCHYNFCHKHKALATELWSVRKMLETVLE
jgi:hypothetical protein